MNSDLVFRALMALVVCATGALLAFAPTFSPAGVVLGVRVPRTHLAEGSVTSALRTYQRLTLGGGVVFAVIVLVFGSNPLVLLGSLGGLGIVAAVSFATQRSRILAAKRAGGWFATVPTAVTGRIAGGVEPVMAVPWVKFLVAGALALIGGLYIAARWADVPEVIPTHFDATMTPDTWADKSIGAVFFGVFFALGLVAFLAGMCWVLSTVTIHARSDRSAAGRASNRAVIADNLTMMGTLALVMAGGFTLLQVITLFPEFERARPVAFVAFLVAVFGTAAVMAVRTLVLRRRYAAQADHSDEAESPDNDEFFRLGVFYYNPDDPAVLVDKRTGVGVNFNYATWQGKLVAAFAVAFVALAIALPFILG